MTKEILSLNEWKVWKNGGIQVSEQCVGNTIEALGSVVQALYLSHSGYCVLPEPPDEEAIFELCDLLETKGWIS